MIEHIHPPAPKVSYTDLTQVQFLRFEREMYTRLDPELRDGMLTHEVPAVPIATRRAWLSGAMVSRVLLKPLNVDRVTSRNENRHGWWGAMHESVDKETVPVTFFAAEAGQAQTFVSHVKTHLSMWDHQTAGDSRADEVILERLDPDGTAHEVAALLMRSQVPDTQELVIRTPRRGEWHHPARTELELANSYLFRMAFLSNQRYAG